MSTSPSPKPTQECHMRPFLPCPHCGANLLAEGFHNSCSETQKLREDNFPMIISGKMYLEHDEHNIETIEHECDVEAYCTSCGNLLPWPLYQLRGELDGIHLSDADAAIAKLTAEANGGPESSAA